MWWHYILIFLGSLIVDIVPFPIMPAFAVMLFFYVAFDLNLWFVIIAGVAGSVIGRSILAKYIPWVSKRIFNKAKNDDVHYLGARLKQKGWKGQMFILAYSLLPLPTTPLFVAGGMAKLSRRFMIPPFTIGKIISNAWAVYMGSYVVKNSPGLLDGEITWEAVSALLLGIAMICALIFIDWHATFRHKLKFKFNIWK